MNVFFLLSILGASHALPDIAHMQKCLPAVRSFIADGGDSVDWLFEKANNETDVVLLYMLRMCYFHHERDDLHQYNAKRLFSKVAGSVESFGDYEFELLTQAIKQEMVSGKPYEELVNKLEGEGEEWIQLLYQPAVVGLGVTGLLVGVLIRQNRLKRIKKD